MSRIEKEFIVPDIDIVSIVENNEKDAIYNNDNSSSESFDFESIRTNPSVVTDGINSERIIHIRSFESRDPKLKFVI